MSTKRMNWQRGFFRVWVVLVALWITFALAVGSGSVFNPYVPTKVVATPSGGTIQLYDRYGAQQREFDEGVAAGRVASHVIQGDYLLYTRADIEPARLEERLTEARDVVADYVRTESTARRSAAIGPVVGWTFIPPIIVLLLGAAIAWALSGFRQAT